MMRARPTILLALAGALALAGCGGESGEPAPAPSSERGPFAPKFEAGERDLYEWRQHSVSSQVNAFARFEMEIEDRRLMAIETLAVDEDGATVRLTFERVRSAMKLDGAEEFSFDSEDTDPAAEPNAPQERALRVLTGVVVDAVVGADGVVVAIRGLEGAQRQVARLQPSVRRALNEAWFRGVIERVFRPMEEPPAAEVGATFEVVGEANMGRLPATGTVTTVGTVESVDEQRAVVQTRTTLDAEFDSNAGGGRILEHARTEVIVWDRQRGRLARSERRSTMAAMREMSGVQAEERREVESGLRRVRPGEPDGSAEPDASARPGEEPDGADGLDSGNPPADGASDDAGGDGV